jgi:hypothetical protein
MRSIGWRGRVDKAVWWWLALRFEDLICTCNTLADRFDSAYTYCASRYGAYTPNTTRGGRRKP